MSLKSQFSWREIQADISKQPFPFLPAASWLKGGLTPTEVTEDLGYMMSCYIVLDRGWRKPFSIKSNFARRGAWHVALAASEGLITTNMGENMWGNRWNTTEIGLETRTAIDELLCTVFKKANGGYDTIN